ncbi:hypothetical protein PG996_001711 [Apiospora saccharicola]|uniref:DUF4484 domain-containing protein n=1 Tax=Apiospora saccharicola TaxID=335842 RepID=A0ABR1WHE6_9PEZI
MAATRRGQPELHVRLPPRSPATPTSAAAWADRPSISALFLIDFDVKAGYTISWKASRPDVELEGVVEYKSLPSGLHTVTDDLIYFVHGDYAGLSAFVNAPCEDTEARNARMLAVGVLVPLSYGRLGRAWKHAEGLKEMASQLADDAKRTQLLEEYWEKHQARDEQDAADATTKEPAASAPTTTTTTTTTTQSQQQPRTPKRANLRSRSASDGAALLQPEHKLSNFHPAWSLKKLLDTFGPLIFPIHRAALLRKRILISCHAPVQEINNFVYDISILSNIPLSTYNLLAPDCPSHRLRPLFTVGVHDIPFLIDTAKPKAQEELPDSESGWIACTTDSILAMKDTLWDMLITMPLPHTAQAKEHVWPTVECPRGNVVKATQRDLRRFRSLKNALVRLESHSSLLSADSPGTSSTTSRPPATPSRPSDDPLVDETDKIVEPQTWTALAYNGFMWWASAGEQARSNEAEEQAHDADLLADMYSSPSMTMSMNVPRSADLTSSSATPFGSSQQTRRLSTTATSAPLPPEEARVELAVIAYFHRLTSTILTKLADLVEDHGADDDDTDTESNMMDDGIDEDEEDDVLLPQGGEGGNGRGIRISIEALRAMGLDIWSASDVEFVRESLAVYFGRRAYVEGKGVEVCGVRVC